MQSLSEQPDYGLDAPSVVRNFLLGGVASAVLYCVLRFAGIVRIDALPFIGATFLVEAAYMVWSSRIGKLRQRENLIHSLALKGDKKVLDVGCGRGLLLNAAAKRLSSGGKAVGLDLWQAEDLSGNTIEQTLENARCEGVQDRVEVCTGDMRQMPFESAAFDVVVSSMAIHNVPDKEGRRQAVHEIVRVLKPGGVCVLQDFRSTDEYEQALRDAGMHDVRRSGLIWLLFPPVRIVSAVKPRF